MTNQSMTLPGVLSELARQRVAVETAVARVDASHDLLGLLLVGSLASGAADAVSDVDLIALVADGHFDRAWHNRHALSEGSLYRWDVGPRGRAGAHKWLTADLVLVECLIGEPGAIRVADPWIQVAGSDVADLIVRREPIPRAEVRSGELVTDDVESLYDALKLWVRGDKREARLLARAVARREADDGADAGPE